MIISRLDITHFRNLSLTKIDHIANGFNLFHGVNGSGKTNLLEAIYYLSRGRSFRQSTASHLIHHMAEKFSIFGHIQSTSLHEVPVGIERQRNGNMRIRVSGQENVSAAELLELIPSILIHSHSFNLLDGGPLFRRKYLDWGAFYVTNEFLAAWKMYERALRQRNAALRESRPKKELDVWRAELVKSATGLDVLRQEYITKLLPFLESLLSELIQMDKIELVYYPGWDPHLTYDEAIDRWGDKDMYVGYTQLGPHRADLKISINRIPVKDILSRGQQKLFICAMMVAQGALLYTCANRKPVYLIDDLPSELDGKNRSHLLELLSKQNAQVFMTAIERDMLAHSCQVPMKMFHVEHGSVREEY